MRIVLDKEQLDGEDGRGLEIAVTGFKGDIGKVPAQVFVEYYNGELRVFVWDGSGEDPTFVHIIPPIEESEE